MTIPSDRFAAFVRHIAALGLRCPLCACDSFGSEPCLYELPAFGGPDTDGSLAVIAAVTLCCTRCAHLLFFAADRLDLIPDDLPHTCAEATIH